MSDKIVRALVKASNCLEPVIGEMYALHYYGHLLNIHQRRAAIVAARESTEKLLVALVAAEQDIAPAVKPEPSNVIQIGDHDPEYQRVVETVGEIVGSSA